MQRWAGRVALVTGASAGIGEAIVKTLVRHGMKVVGCSRNVAKIQALSEELKHEPGSVKAIQCDVSKETDILCMFEMIRQDPDLGGVDVCISNAGLAHPDPLLSGSTEGWRHMLEVNVLGLCVCTREAFKSMQERKVDDGHLILISSISGHQVNPMKNLRFYSATKFAVSAIGEGIRTELREMQSGVKVSMVSPGVVETDFRREVFPNAATDLFEQMQVHDVLVRPKMQA